MKKFKFTPLTIPEVILIESAKFEDNRGFFSETYNQEEFAQGGINETFVQDSYSYSKQNVLRGLHFSKPPHEAAKLVRCSKGEILDVVVDIRPDSTTFGKWVSEKLTEENGKMLFIPKGFAHGFVALSEFAGVTYKVSEFFRPESDAGIAWNDPDIAVDWGIENPILSDKDQQLPSLKETFNEDN